MAVNKRNITSQYGGTYFINVPKPNSYEIVFDGSLIRLIYNDGRFSMILLPNFRKKKK